LASSKGKSTPRLIVGAQSQLGVKLAASRNCGSQNHSRPEGLTDVRFTAAHRLELSLGEREIDRFVVFPTNTALIIQSSAAATLACTNTLLYKVHMKVNKYTIATMELALIFPAVLFMTALFVRNLQPPQYEPAHTAHQIVAWYAARPRIGLWGLLIALPLAVLVMGCGTLLRGWSRETELRQAARNTLATLSAHLSTLLVAAATLAAGGVLAIVTLHVLTDRRILTPPASIQSK
jgi:hypothetical protein